jgi:hypothetical protein
MNDNQNVTIDNGQFKEFVLKNSQMSEEEEEKFTKAIPKMTEAEKAEIIFMLKAGQYAQMLKELREKIDSSENGDVASIEEQYLSEKRQGASKGHEEGRIEEIKNNLSQMAHPEHKKES